MKQLPSQVKWKFNTILGNDALKQLNAIIFTKKNYLLIDNNKKIPLFQLQHTDVNNIEVDDNITNIYKNKLRELI